MPNPEFDKLPSLLQMAAVVGTAVAGFVAYLLGARSNKFGGQTEQQRIDERDAELIESRALERVRLVVTSSCESIRTEMNALENRHRETHQEIFERIRELERGMQRH